ncbi:MAG: hypothetical protein U1F16_10745 [Turneriella sp.]
MQNCFSQNFVVFVLTSLLTINCSKSDGNSSSASTTTSNGNSQTETNTANAAFDSSAKGLYKGVLTGSSGSWTLDYDNGNTSALPTFEYKYTPTGGSECTDKITGSVSGSGPYTLSFSSSTKAPCAVVTFAVQIVISATGTINSATLTIAGVSSGYTIIGNKQTSTNLVRNFEGTFSGNVVAALGGAAVSGVWNFYTNADVSVTSHTKTLVGCSFNCDGDSTSNLDVTTKGLSNVPGTEKACISALSGCLCRDYVTTNSGITLSSNSVSGTWASKISTSPASCTTASPLLVVGYTIASGTFTGTKK